MTTSRERLAEARELLEESLYGVERGRLWAKDLGLSATHDSIVRTQNRIRVWLAHDDEERDDGD